MAFIPSPLSSSRRLATLAEAWLFSTIHNNPASFQLASFLVQESVAPKTGARGEKDLRKAFFLGTLTVAGRTTNDHDEQRLAIGNALIQNADPWSPSGAQGQAVPWGWHALASVVRGLAPLALLEPLLKAPGAPSVNELSTTRFEHSVFLENTEKAPGPPEKTVLGWALLPESFYWKDEDEMTVRGFHQHRLESLDSAIAVKALLSLGVDPNVPLSSDGKLSLEAATNNENYRLLCENGAQPSVDGRWAAFNWLKKLPTSAREASETSRYEPLASVLLEGVWTPEQLSGSERKLAWLLAHRFKNLSSSVVEPMDEVHALVQAWSQAAARPFSGWEGSFAKMAWEQPKDNLSKSRLLSVLPLEKLKTPLGQEYPAGHDAQGALLCLHACYDPEGFYQSTPEQYQTALGVLESLPFSSRWIQAWGPLGVLLAENTQFDQLVALSAPFAQKIAALNANDSPDEWKAWLSTDGGLLKSLTRHLGGISGSAAHNQPTHVRFSQTVLAIALMHPKTQVLGLRALKSWEKAWKDGVYEHSSTPWSDLTQACLVSPVALASAAQKGPQGEALYRQAILELRWENPSTPSRPRARM